MGLNIFQLRSRLEKIDINAAVKVAVEATKGDLLRLNKEQMLAGKDRTGKNISPSYLDDPFFKTKKAAQAYSDWKDRITPNAKRAPGIPNLFITGQLVHDPLAVLVQKSKVKFTINSKIGGKIETKYGQNIEGVGGEFKTEYVGLMKPFFRAEIKRQIFNGK